MSRTDPQFKLRMPTELHAQLEQIAKEARRSLNAEIVLRLEATFAQAKQEVSQ
ncbi:Arc family DNA-binding protein [Pseudomonas sp. CC6-YY-74]|uniref:Arc family DNA-binding protein n=1 Tax=Pseudomonas sp. CC6-YY-74 TaxID=1930532 RepID=UPI0009A22186|nr:Arc family DNA-binding protein [Pseudomonas sp. CC6-YY-74]